MTPSADETPTSNGTSDSDGEGTSFERELAQAALARSNEDVTRYTTIGQILERVESKADAAIKDVRGMTQTIRTTADGVSDLRVAMTRQELRLATVERAAALSDERHGQIMAVLARLESRESEHRTELKSITNEVGQVKAAHGGWLAVGSFMDRHRKLASTVAFLVLLGFQIFHLLKK